MTAILNWLSMGGFAQYVWPSYALIMGVVLVHIMGLKRQRARTRSMLMLLHNRS